MQKGGVENLEDCASSTKMTLLINEVNLRRSLLVLGWLTVSRFDSPGGDTLFRYVTNHPGRLSLLSFLGW